MRRFALSLLAILTCTAAWSQEPCPTVKGVVVDMETKSPLPGANIVAKNNPGTGTSTDSGGAFEWKAGARDSLLVSFVGYQSQWLVVGSECQVTVRLVPDAGSLAELVIQSERYIAEEFTIRKIRKLEIYTNPSAKADPILAVNSTSSATTTDESANISLRGSSPAETGIFLNNVPINDAVRYSQLNGIGTFSIFNTALISQVSVYPGNPPLEYGSTTSGLIALQTDETIPRKPVNTLSLTLASMGLYTERKLNRRSSLTAFSNYQPSAMIRALNPESLARVRSFSSVDLGVHYLLHINDETILKLFAYGIKESYQFAAIQPTYTGDFNQHKLRGFSIVNLRRKFANSEITVNGSMSYSKADYSLSTLDVDLRLRDLFSSVNYQYFGTKADVKAGISYDSRHSDYQGKYPLYPYAIGDQYPVDSAASIQSISVPEAYTYVKYYLAPKITLGAGLRKNVAVDDQKDFLSAQLNANFKPSKNWNINVAAGRYNKYQLAQSEAQLPFLIEADQYSIDVSRSKTDFEHSLSLYYKRSSFEGTRTEVRGLEWFVKYRFSPNLRGQLSLTSLDASLTKQNGSQPSPYDIHYFVRGNLEYKFAYTWTFTTVFLFRQGSFHLPVTSATFQPGLQVFEPTYGSPARLPSYDIIDLSLSRVLPIGESSAVAFAGISNILNFRNVRGYSYNFDYSAATEDLFSLRTVYVGFILNF